MDVLVFTLLSVCLSGLACSLESKREYVIVLKVVSDCFDVELVGFHVFEASEVIWHDTVYYVLNDIERLQMFKCDAFARVFNLINVKLHFVKVFLQSLFGFLVCDFDLF